MTTKMSYSMGLVVEANSFRTNTPGQSPARPRNAKMDAFMKHIHHNKALTVESLVNAMDAVKEKKAGR